MCSKHLVFVGLVGAGWLVWVQFALLMLLFFLILSKLKYLLNLHAQLYEKGKVKESLLVFGAGNRELFSSGSLCCRARSAQEGLPGLVILGTKS